MGDLAHKNVTDSQKSEIQQDDTISARGSQPESGGESTFSKGSKAVTGQLEPSQGPSREPSRESSPTKDHSTATVKPLKPYELDLEGRA